MRGFSDYVDWEIARNQRVQYRYLCDRRGQLLVDQVGYYERLGADAARIFAALDVDLAPLPHIGQFTRRDYRDFYDAKTRKKVAAHWARDLELFGYDFEGLAEDATGHSRIRAD